MITPRTGRRRKLRIRKKSRRKMLGIRNPAQLAAATGRRRARRVRRR